MIHSCCRSQTDMHRKHGDVHDEGMENSECGVACRKNEIDRRNDVNGTLLDIIRNVFSDCIPNRVMIEIANSCVDDVFPFFRPDQVSPYEESSKTWKDGFQRHVEQKIQHKSNRRDERNHQWDERQQYCECELYENPRQLRSNHPFWKDHVLQQSCLCHSACKCCGNRDSVHREEKSRESWSSSAPCSYSKSDDSSKIYSKKLPESDFDNVVKELIGEIMNGLETFMKTRGGCANDKERACRGHNAQSTSDMDDPERTSVRFTSIKPVEMRNRESDRRRSEKSDNTRIEYNFHRHSCPSDVSERGAVDFQRNMPDSDDAACENYIKYTEGSKSKTTDYKHVDDQRESRNDYVGIDVDTQGVFKMTTDIIATILNRLNRENNDVSGKPNRQTREYTRVCAGIPGVLHSTIQSRSEKSATCEHQPEESTKVKDFAYGVTPLQSLVEDARGRGLSCDDVKRIIEIIKKCVFKSELPNDDKKPFIAAGIDGTPSGSKPFKQYHSSLEYSKKVRGSCRDPHPHFVTEIRNVESYYPAPTGTQIDDKRRCEDESNTKSKLRTIDESQNEPYKNGNEMREQTVRNVPIRINRQSQGIDVKSKDIITSRKASSKIVDIPFVSNEDSHQQHYGHDEPANRTSPEDNRATTCEQRIEEEPKGFNEIVPYTNGQQRNDTQHGEKDKRLSVELTVTVVKPCVENQTETMTVHTNTDVDVVKVGPDISSEV